MLLSDVLLDPDVPLVRDELEDPDVPELLDTLLDPDAPPERLEPFVVVLVREDELEEASRRVVTDDPSVLMVFVVVRAEPFVFTRDVVVVEAGDAFLPVVALLEPDV